MKSEAIKLLVDDRDTLRQKRKKERKKKVYKLLNLPPSVFISSEYSSSYSKYFQAAAARAKRFTIDRLIIEDRWILYQLKLVFN